MKRARTVSTSIATPMRLRPAVRQARLRGSLSTRTPSQSKITRAECASRALSKRGRSPRRPRRRRPTLWHGPVGTGERARPRPLAPRRPGPVLPGGAPRRDARHGSEDPAMFRFLARVLGFLLMAGGFVALVYDGARSIANNGLRVTPLSRRDRHPVQGQGRAPCRAASRAAAPWLWHLLGLPLTLAPGLAARARPRRGAALARPAGPGADRVPDEALIGGPTAPRAGPAPRRAPPSAARSRR